MISQKKKGKLYFLRELIISFFFLDLFCELGRKRTDLDLVNPGKTSNSKSIIFFLLLLLKPPIRDLIKIDCNFIFVISVEKKIVRYKMSQSDFAPFFQEHSNR
jgi:hypothetical protein